MIHSATARDYVLTGLAVLVAACLIVITAACRKMWRQREPGYIPKHSVNPEHQAYWKAAGKRLAIAAAAPVTPDNGQAEPVIVLGEFHLDH